MTDFVYVNSAQLETFITQILCLQQVSLPHAQTVARVLETADKRNIPSHGFARFKAFYSDKIKNGLINPTAKPELVRDVLATGVIDAHNGLGHPAAEFAMNTAIEKAKQHGMGMTTVRNSNHYGVAGFYAEMALAHGMIGITGTNARPAVAPTNGVDAMFGTNPIAVAMPSDDDFPFLFDAATTIAQRGKVETYARRGKTLPKGWVIDKTGAPITEPTEVLKMLLNNTAALQPLGGATEELGSHKGYGLATVVELLSSALSQGNFLRQLNGITNGKSVPNGLGHFFMAIKIDCFCDASDFCKSVGDVCRQLRASQKMPGHSEILTAGLREYRAEKYNIEHGIPFDAEMLSDLKYLSKEFKIDTFKHLPF